MQGKKLPNKNARFLGEVRNLWNKQGFHGNSPKANQKSLVLITFRVLRRYSESANAVDKIINPAERELLAKIDRP